MPRSSFQQRKAGGQLMRRCLEMLASLHACWPVHWTPTSSFCRKAGGAMSRAARDCDLPAGVCKAEGQGPRSCWLAGVMGMTLVSGRQEGREGPGSCWLAGAMGVTFCAACFCGFLQRAGES
eukprot:225994-Pelagomonas_calceolata.AAC.2